MFTCHYIEELHCDPSSSDFRASSLPPDSPWAVNRSLAIEMQKISPEHPFNFYNAFKNTMGNPEGCCFESHLTVSI